MVHDALRQAVLRPFVALDELLELKLNFLSVAFFLPCRPFIVVPMLLARILEGHTDLSKLLFIARAGLSPPRPPSLTGRRAATLPSSPCSPWCGRWRSLSTLVTYNEKLYVPLVVSRALVGADVGLRVGEFLEHLECSQ